MATTPDFLNTLNPSAQAAPAPSVPQAEVPQAEAVEAKPKAKKSTVVINSDHIKYVLENIKTQTYTEMAEVLGITKNQINRILQDLKTGLRNKAKEKAEADGVQPYGMKTIKGKDGKPDKQQVDYTKPLTETAKVVEAKIQESLTRPIETRPGAGGGAVKEVIEDKLNQILGGLNLG